jgi:GNAT superfamily N-acetyltransferase
VGSVRAHALDSRSGWFGVLGVDPAVHGRGFGEALVRFVEDDAAAAGRGTMQLEVLRVPTDISPPVASPGVVRAARVPRDVTPPTAALYPEDAPRLLVAVMDVVTMRRPL